MKIKRKFVIIALLSCLAVFCLVCFVWIKLKEREESLRLACLGRLQVTVAAKDQCKLEYGLTNGAFMTTRQFEEFIPIRITNFLCPAGGVYTIGPIGTRPKCSILGHGLSEQWGR